MAITIASILAGGLGVAIILIGGRFILAPRAGAAGYGVPVDSSAERPTFPWL